MEPTDRSNQVTSSTETTSDQSSALTTERPMQSTESERPYTAADVAEELESLKTMSLDALRSYYFELFGVRSTSSSKPYLRKCLAYRIQEIEEGGLSQRALDRIEELSQNLPERWRYPRNWEAKQAEPAPDGVEVLDSTPEDPDLEEEEPAPTAPSNTQFPQHPECQPALPFKFPVMRPSADVSTITVIMTSPKGDLSLIFDLSDLNNAP